MVVLALGVKKSLIFNNVLNAINFAAWVFIMSAGLFYIKLDRWSNFLPYGWSGVSTREKFVKLYTVYSSLRSVLAEDGFQLRVYNAEGGETRVCIFDTIGRKPFSVGFSVLRGAFKGFLPNVFRMCKKFKEGADFEDILGTVF